MDNIIYIIMISIILFCSIIARLIFTNWLNPVSIYSIWMIAYCIIAVLFFGHTEVILTGMSWVVISTMGLLIGATCLVLMLNKFKMRPNMAITNYPSTKLIKILSNVLIICIILEISGVIITFYSVRGHAALIETGNFIIDSAASTAQYRSDVAYGLKEDSIDQYFFGWLSYFGALVGGLLWGLSSKLCHRLLGFIPVILTWLTSMLTASRMGFMYAAAFSISAVIASLNFKSSVGNVGKSFLPLLKVTCLAFFIALTLTFIATNFRSFNKEINIIEMSVAEPFSYMHSFSIWLDKGYLESSDLLFGYRTFWRLYDKMGHTNIPQYNINTFGLENNILTSLQGLLEDFGKSVFIFLTFAFGFIAAFSYKMVVSGHKAWIPILTALYASIFLCPAFSVTQYNQPIMALCLFYISMFLVKSRQPQSAIIKTIKDLN